MSYSPRLQVMTVALAVAIGVAGCSKSSQPISPSSVTAGGSLGTLPPPGFVDPNPGQPNPEFFEVCKAYAGGTGPSPVTFTFTVDEGTDGSINFNGSIQVPAGECRLVWTGGGPTGDTVTITENPIPSGFVPSVVVMTIVNGQVTSQSILGNQASGRVAGGRGITALFTNTAEAEAGTGRFTGGGNQIKLPDNIRVSRGLTIHCDLDGSNNLEVNWGNGNNFHMTQHLTATCTDSPTIIQAPPAAPLDTMVGTGIGKFNGVAGFTVHFTLVDHGEPGENDEMRILIFETANPSNIVLNVPLQVLANGNLQAHFDQPHR